MWVELASPSDFIACINRTEPGFPISKLNQNSSRISEPQELNPPLNLNAQTLKRAYLASFTRKKLQDNGAEY